MTWELIGVFIVFFSKTQTNSKKKINREKKKVNVSEDFVTFFLVLLLFSINQIKMCTNFEKMKMGVLQGYLIPKTFFGSKIPSAVRP